MKEAPGSSETSILTIATRRNNPENTILHNTASPHISQLESSEMRGGAMSSATLSTYHAKPECVAISMTTIDIALFACCYFLQLEISSDSGILGEIFGSWIVTRTCSP
jgi:hypothetical protein